MAVVRSIRIAVAETSGINSLHDFCKSQNMHNSAFRYKLDTNSKAENVDIQSKTHILIYFKGQI